MRSARTTSSCPSRAGRSRSMASSMIRSGRPRASPSDFEQQRRSSAQARRIRVQVAVAIDDDHALHRRADVGGARRRRRRAHPARRHPAGRAIHRLDRSVAHAAARVLVRGDRARRARRLDPHRRQRVRARHLVGSGVDAQGTDPRPTAGRPRWRSRCRSCGCRASRAASWGINFNWYVPHPTRTCSGCPCRSIAPRGRATSAS